MKHHLVILSLLFYLGGTSLGHAAQVFCPSDSGTVSVLLAKEKGDKSILVVDSRTPDWVAKARFRDQ